MTEKQTNKAVFVVACVKCATLNRVEAEFTVEPAKTIGAEEERKKEEAKDVDGKENSGNKAEGEAVRPDTTKGVTDGGDSGDKQENQPGVGGATADETTRAETTTDTPTKGTRRNRQHKKGLK